MLENYLLLIFAIIIVVAIVITLIIEREGHISLEKGEHLRKKVETFCQIFSAFCIIITLIFYYSVINLQKQQQKIFELTETMTVNNSLYKELFSELMKQQESPFVKSLFPFEKFSETQVDIEIPKVNELNTFSNFILSQRIFAVWQELVEIDGFNSIGLQSFINTFLQFCKSEQLRIYWNTTKNNYGSQVKMFGDLLFQYSKNINPENIDNVSEEFLKQPEIKEIFPQFKP